MTGTSAPGAFVTWAADGKFRRKIGREGEGPGELIDRPTLMLDPTDSIHVRDGGMRWSVFSPSREFVRMASGRALIAPRHAVFLPSGSVISSFNPLESNGQLFQVLHRETGEIVRSFGTPAESERQPRRLVIGATDTTFWAIPLHKLQIEEWSETGQLVRALTPDRLWVDRQSDEVWSGNGTPVPVITSLAFDPGSNLIWIRGMVPDARTFDHGSGASSDDISSLYDFVIHVIDAESGRTVAMEWEGTIQASVSSFLGPDEAYRETRGNFGLMRYEILRMVLEPVTTLGTR